MKKKKLLVACLLVFPILSITLIQKAYAIPLSPDKYYVDLKAGETIEEKLTIYGREEYTNVKKVYITAVGMRKTGEQNDREFYLSDPLDKTELANYITLGQTEATIEPGETVIVPWTLEPSDYIGCGTNLAALMVSTEPLTTEVRDGEAKVSFKQEVISQIHVTVDSTKDGDCPDNKAILELLDFHVDKGIPIFNHGDVPFITRIENKGNLISRSPKGYIEIFGFGDKVTIPFNEQELDIYPNTIRKFDNQWLDEKYPTNGNVFSKLIYEITHLRIGRYEARLGITKNVDTQIVKSVYFWVIPWKVILLVLLIVSTVIYLFIRSRKAESKLKKMEQRQKKL
jgi:hypothetical protein